MQVDKETKVFLFSIILQKLNKMKKDKENYKFYKVRVLFGASTKLNAKKRLSTATNDYFIVHTWGHVTAVYSLWKKCVTL